jgi:hypothetical protein
MGIMLWYENMPHFCFSYGRIGHAALSCIVEEPMDQGIKYGEELRASPTRRVREVVVKRTPPRASRQLFQADVHPTPPVQYANEMGRARVGHADGSSPNMGGNPSRGAMEAHGDESDAVAAKDLADGVRELQVVGRSENASCGSAKGKRKDRVSFGTNMTSTEEESSESGPVKQEVQRLDRVVAKMQSRKDAAHAERVRGKKAVLRVQGAGTRKSQKTLVKTGLRAAPADLEVDGKLVKEELETSDQQERMEEDSTGLVRPSKSNPGPLTGPHDEARQEKLVP